MTDPMTATRGAGASVLHWAPAALEERARSAAGAVVRSLISVLISVGILLVITIGLEVEGWWRWAMWIIGLVSALVPVGLAVVRWLRARADAREAGVGPVAEVGEIGVRTAVAGLTWPDVAVCELRPGGFWRRPRLVVAGPDPSLPPVLDVPSDALDLAPGDLAAIVRAHSGERVQLRLTTDGT